MDNLFRHLHMPSELAYEFLAVFARMEYAKGDKIRDGRCRGCLCMLG